MNSGFFLVFLSLSKNYQVHLKFTLSLYNIIRLLYTVYYIDIWKSFITRHIFTEKSKNNNKKNRLCKTKKFFIPLIITIWQFEMMVFFHNYEIECFFLLETVKNIIKDTYLYKLHFLIYNLNNKRESKDN
jgi:hypothetical protein